MDKLLGSKPALHQVQTLGGVWFTVPTIVNGSWNIVDLNSVVQE